MAGVWHAQVNCDWRHGINGFQVGTLRSLWRYRLVLLGAQLESNRVGLSFRTLPSSRTFGEVMKRRSCGRPGRSRGGYRHDLDRVRRGRRDAGRGSRQRGAQAKCASGHPGRRNAIQGRRLLRRHRQAGLRLQRGTAFAFREPVAGLLSRGVQAAIHGKGPFWASFDGSRVDGSGRVPTASPAYTDLTKNVPWLKVVGTPMPNRPACSAMSRSFSGSTRAGASRPRERARRRRP